jgi:CxxC motif-containing protein (DUF1111 family)
MLMSRAFLVLGLFAIAACNGEPVASAPDQPAVTPPTTGDGPVSEDELLSISGDGRRNALSGGATTVFDVTGEAFSHAAPNLSAASLARHDVGDLGFDEAFVPGALGPVFDNVSCESCHFEDGRGRPPAQGEEFASMLFRASVPGVMRLGRRSNPRGAEAPAPVPGFGSQLQMRAVPGQMAEISASVTYVDSSGTFADGTPFTLQSPRYTLTGVYAALPATLMFSPRVAPVVFGLGLLEAIPQSTIESNADPFDRNRDGISGRANYMEDLVSGQPRAIGRFGWKANTPNLVQQAAAAYNGDMGITSTLFPGESCEEYRAECAAHPIEVSDSIVAAVGFYTQSLAVPARRNLDDRQVLLGEVLFRRAGCAGCHLPSVRTGVMPGIPEVSNQQIQPFTDLLLHDMGKALADGRPDFKASGSEWRTPPLWGIGLVQTVNGHSRFLHDGRARSLLEAVLWHGGEAERSRVAVQRFSASERAALVKFLESL